MKNIAQDSFLGLPVLIPPLSEQQRIVAVLDSWDRAIDQTERLIAAKRKRKTGMLVRVFGNERNPLKIKGTPLGDIATIHYGKGLAPADYTSEGQSPVFGTQGEIGRTNRRLFEGPAIIVGRKGTLDKPVLVDSSRPIWAIDTVFVVKPKTNARMLHAFLDLIDLTKLNEASGVPSISSENLGALYIPSGAIEKAEKSEPVILALQKDIEEVERRLGLLISQKRGLMQKLLSGEWQLDERFDPPTVNNG
jgi:type I restriction enzyme, S subunit